MPSDSLDKIGLLMQQFPAEFSHFWGFECRLGEKDSTVDWLVCVTKKDINALENWSFSNSEWSQNPFWNRIGIFSTKWIQSDSPESQRIKNLWLEFDLGEEKLPEIPNLFWGLPCVKPEVLQKANAAQWLGEDFIPQITGIEIDKTIIHQLARSIEFLPEQGYIFQMGYMAARSQNGIRICVRGMRQNEAFQYLRNMGWPGDLSRLVNRLAPLTGTGMLVDIDLDLFAEGVGPVLGLECSFRRQDDPGWEVLIDYLVGNGWCKWEKKGAILGFGRKVFFAGESLHLTVNHIKLTVKENNVFMAKGYLGVRNNHL